MPVPQLPVPPRNPCFSIPCLPASLPPPPACLQDGKILGCQATGVVAGVEKRVDVVAMCMQMGGTVFDLEEAELCYAPQYGSAKDPVNIAGAAPGGGLGWAGGGGGGGGSWGYTDAGPAAGRSP